MKHPLSSYFVTHRDFDVAAVHDALLSPGIDAEIYGKGSQQYCGAVIDQYKLYVEMADRVSARRALANTFFLTLNTAVFTIIGVLWNRRPQAASYVLLFPLAVLVIECLTWFWLLRSYRQLNAAKYVVIGALESHLPVSPYWRAEWKALGEGHDPARYWPLSHVEAAVPLLFAITYVGAFLVAVTT